MRNELSLEGLLSRPNRVLGAALLLLAALAWFQLVGGGLAGGMASHHAHAGIGLMHPQPHAWGPRELGLTLLMWMLMAVAMMLPIAAPAILAFADVVRAGYQGAAARARVGAFLLGYLTTWWSFGVLATAAQWELTAVALRVSARNAQGALGGTLLVGAGLYQFSAMKDRCLSQCRSPLAFFLGHWRNGVRGASYLGWRHGLHCVGCCWALMALMLCAGAMNAAWAAALTALMFIEKITPAGRTIGRAVGVALILWGGALSVSPLLGD